MAVTCEICGRENASRKDRYCPQHAKQVLRRLDREGYLEPLLQQTISGPVRLSSRQFLTLPDDNSPTTPET